MSFGAGRRLRWAIFPLLAMLHGCAMESLPPFVAEPVPIQRIVAWRLEGRVAVQTPAEGWSANLVWKHDPDSDHLAFSGPMQQRAATILARKDFVSFRSADGTDIVASDADALLRERVGITIPLGVLRYWVLGVPAPEHDFAPDPSGEDARDFLQLGWAMHYGEYLPVAEMRLPRKLTATGEGMKLKLVVDEWRIE